MYIINELVERPRFNLIRRANCPPFLFGGGMSCLSIFVDESGDFGPYDSKSPYYIVTLVIHTTSQKI